MMKMVTKTKQKRIKPDLPGGFRDYGSGDAIAKQEMIDIIRRTFESFGYDPLETASVQRSEVLTGGEEDSGKIIFNVKGSREQSAQGKSDNSLRFDLTVPLARFLAENPEIPKPFKRYEIGKVWRGESPQAGRYREFTQADVDIVGSSAIEADAEIAMIIYTVFKKLGINNFVIHYNNRKMLDNLPGYAGFSEGKLWEALRIIDKRDKIGRDGVCNELKKTFSKKIADKILEFLMSDSEPTLQGEGLQEYGKIAGMLFQNTGRNVDRVDKFFKLKRTLVRGLSYYTGSVFEVMLPDAPEIGSVCGGGRYDDLVSKFTGQKIPAVGASIGIDRLFAAKEKLGQLTKKQTKTQVLLFRMGLDIPTYSEMAQELRATGINTALYLGDDPTFQAQLAYAVKKAIPYIVIYGAKERKEGVVAIKNLATREQKEIPRDRLIAYFEK